MTKTKSAAALRIDHLNKGLVEDAVLYIPRNQIHPDPDQPRVKVDADLQSSIDADGIHQAITVRPHPETADEWMIVDGERRWLGGAHLKTIPCRIRLDLEDPSNRLIMQLAANAGRPLSPIELARAYKKALDADPRLSQAELAKRLGVPRTTIGDRIRLVSLDKAWLDLIDKEILQVSHGPELHLYAGVPSKYQGEAAKKIREDAGKSKDPIAVDGFNWDLQQAFEPFLKELGEVSPQYDGPVIELAKWGRKGKFAADPDLWKPILADKKKRAREAGKSSGSHRSVPRFESAMSKTIKGLKAAGYDVPARKATGYSDLKPKAGETTILESSSWADGIHPATLLEKLDPSTLTLLTSQYGGQKLVTSDNAAVAAAREAYRAKVAEVSKRVLAPLTGKLSDKALAAYAITGPGVIGLFGYMDLERGDEKTVATAIGIPVDGGDISQADAERLLAALAICAAQEIKIPDSWSIENQIRKSVGSPEFKVAKNKAPATSAEPKSKKQQKREARAAGKQVGDPTRAKNGFLEDPEVEFAETDLEIEEELVEA